MDTAEREMRQMVSDNMSGYRFGFRDAATKVLDIAREYHKSGEGETFDLLLGIYDRLKAMEPEVLAEEQARWNSIVAQS